MKNRSENGAEPGGFVGRLLGEKVANPGGLIE